MTERGQAAMVWWALATMVIFGLSMWLLMGMVPPPHADLSSAQVAAFYQAGDLKIRFGAAICSWVSAFAVPLSVVITVQMMRIDNGQPFWPLMQLVGGILMSIFLVLPPLFWGVAAFNAHRSPDATALMHELGMLTLTTTDQFYIFQNIAIAVFCFTKPAEPLSPFTRRLGYFTVWAAIMFEVGALAFLFKTGPFAWNGLFVFWFPFVIYGTWISVTSYALLGAIKRQRHRVLQHA